MKSHNHLKYLKEAREKCPANLMHSKDVIEKMFAHRIFTISFMVSNIHGFFFYYTSGASRAPTTTLPLSHTHKRSYKSGNINLYVGVSKFC